MRHWASENWKSRDPNIPKPRITCRYVTYVRWQSNLSSVSRRDVVIGDTSPALLRCKSLLTTCFSRHSRSCPLDPPGPDSDQRVSHADPDEGSDLESRGRDRHRLNRPQVETSLKFMLFKKYSYYFCPSKQKCHNSVFGQNWVKTIIWIFDILSYHFYLTVR